MRRVAQALGAGTMTLYHYVRSKDELVTLMHDAVMGEVLVPEGELPSDWRAALGHHRATLARRLRPSSLDARGGSATRRSARTGSVTSSSRCRRWELHRTSRWQSACMC